MKKSLNNLLNPEANQGNVSEDAITLVSYNMRGPFDKSPNEFYGDRAPRIIEMIKKYDMDVIGTQELIPDTRDALLQKLPDYDCVGVSREDGKNEGEACYIIYKKDRFEVVDSDTFWLSETPNVPGSRSWNTCCTRICTMIRLKDKKTNKEFVHVNTHLDHESEEARIKGIQLIVSEIKRRYTDFVPLVLTGDFNTYVDTPTYKATEELLHDAMKISAVPHAGPFRTFTNWIWEANESTTEGARIDFIFVNDGFGVEEIVTCNDTFPGNTYSSDHYPVVSNLIIK